MRALGFGFEQELRQAMLQGMAFSFINRLHPLQWSQDQYYPSSPPPGN